MGLPTFSVVDIETSGLRPGRDHMLQVGVVTVSTDGTITDRWSTKVHLPHRWSRVGPRRVHGLSRRDLRDAPEVERVMHELATRVNGSVFAAHNANFDAAFIERIAARSGVELDLKPRVCTLDLSRRLDPERALSHRLHDVCDRLGVELTRHHDALADATATARVLPMLLAAHGVTDEEGLEPLYLTRFFTGSGRRSVRRRLQRRWRRWRRPPRHRGPTE